MVSDDLGRSKTIVEALIGGRPEGRRQSCDDRDRCRPAGPQAKESRWPLEAGKEFSPGASGRDASPSRLLVSRTVNA